MASIPGSLGVPSARPGRPPSLVPAALVLLVLYGLVTPARAQEGTEPAALADGLSVDGGGMAVGVEAAVDDAAPGVVPDPPQEDVAALSDNGVDATWPTDPAAPDPAEDQVARAEDADRAFDAAHDPDALSRRQGDDPDASPVTAPGAWLTWDDREAIGRIAFAEAGNQGEEGIAAVVFTVLNRVASGQFQGSVQAVIDAPNQFEPATRAGGWRGLPPLGPARRDQIDALLEDIAAGRLTDPTAGALYFQNARIVARRAEQGLVSPELVDFGGTPPIAEIGDHRFYDARAGLNLAALRQARLAQASGWEGELVVAEQAGETDPTAAADVAAPEDAPAFVLAAEDPEAPAD